MITPTKKALGLSMIAATVVGPVMADVASAGINVDGLLVPYSTTVGTKTKAVYGGRASGDANGFTSLSMTLRGRRSSWSGMRDDGAATYSAGFGNWQKLTSCQTTGTYDRNSRLNISGFVQGGVSIQGGGYGASYTGPVSFNANYDTPSTARFACTV